MHRSILITYEFHPFFFQNDQQNLRVSNSLLSSGNVGVSNAYRIIALGHERCHKRFKWKVCLGHIIFFWYQRELSTVRAKISIQQQNFFIQYPVTGSDGSAIRIPFSKYADRSLSDGSRTNIALVHSGDVINSLCWSFEKCPRYVSPFDNGLCRVSTWSSSLCSVMWRRSLLNVVVATFGTVKYKLVCDSITTTGSLP
mmetsp:Transcript_14849/g.41342  ORF Transcript_14849/g.41342 Transcript_14849/m.41342 type:complete len:198 (+) Transcript_14849:5125-5718(+)